MKEITSQERELEDLSSPKDTSLKVENIKREESLKEKFLSKKEARKEQKYKTKYWFPLILCIILIAIVIFIKTKIDQNNNVINENKLLKNNISGLQKAFSNRDSNLKLKISQLMNENKILQKENSELSFIKDKLNQENLSLKDENINLKEELLQTKQKLAFYLKEEEVNEELELIKGEDELNISCPICKENVPSISLNEKNGTILAHLNCEKCGHEEIKNVKEYLYDLKNHNIHYCQKKDGSHATREAKYFSLGKYYCHECIKEMAKIIESKEIKAVGKDKDLITECPLHGKKLKYYCPQCNKHFCESISETKHDINHQVENLDNLEKLIKIEKYQNKQESLINYVKIDLLNIKNKLVRSLKQMIKETEQIYSNSTKKVYYLLNLGSIALENYQRNKDYPNYFIITNMLYFSKLINQIILPDLSIFYLSDVTFENVEDYYFGFKRITKELLNNPYNQILTAFTKSNIVKSWKEIELILSWLNSRGIFSNIELIYKATFDGETANDFYSKCSNKDATLSIFETQEGKRFGGFTKSSWIRGEQSKIDPSSFLFSLDTQKIYPIKEPYYAISSYENQCQIFGNNTGRVGLFIHDRFLTQGGYTGDLISNYRYITSNNELTGSNEFILKENEVYQINFEQRN